MTISIIESKIIMILLNEFYYLNKESYQNYISKIKTPEYLEFCHHLLTNPKFNNILELFGLVINQIDQHYYHDYNDLTFLMYKKNQVINYQKNYYAVFIYFHPPNYVVKIKFSGKSLGNLKKKQWIKFILNNFKVSNVVEIIDNQDILFKIKPNLIKFNQPKTIWQLVFKNIVWFDLPSLIIKTSHYKKVFLEDELLKNEWEIDRDLNYFKNKYPYTTFTNYLKEIRWNHKKNYILSINRLCLKNRLLDNFYKKLLSLEPYLIKIIYSFF